MPDVSEFGETGGGILHEVPLSERPALPLVVAPEMDALANPARDDLTVLDDEDPTEAGGESSARQRQFSRVARFAALDPADGIPL